MNIPKVNNNQLFVPSLLLFMGFYLWISSQLNIRAIYGIPYILLSAIGFYAIRTFITSFKGLSESVEDKKWQRLLADILLLVISFTLVYSILTQLSVDSYPELAILFLIVANFTNFLSLFLHKHTSYMFYLSTFLVYLLMYLVLRFQIGSRNNTIPLVLQIIAWVIFAFELAHLGLVSKWFLTDKGD
jgi:hypothetical protein